MSRGVGKRCVSQAHAKGLKVDGGAARAHLRRYARLSPEAPATRPEQISTLDIFLGAGMGNRNDLLSPAGEIEGY